MRKETSYLKKNTQNNQPSQNNQPAVLTQEEKILLTIYANALSAFQGLTNPIEQFKQLAILNYWFNQLIKKRKYSQEVLTEEAKKQEQENNFNIVHIFEEKLNIANQAATEINELLSEKNKNKKPIDESMSIPIFKKACIIAKCVKFLQQTIIARKNELITGIGEEKLKQNCKQMAYLLNLLKKDDIKSILEDPSVKVETSLEFDSTIYEPLVMPKSKTSKKIQSITDTKKEVKKSRNSWNIIRLRKREKEVQEFDFNKGLQQVIAVAKGKKKIDSSIKETLTHFFVDEKAFHTLLDKINNRKESPLSLLTENAKKKLGSVTRIFNLLQAWYYICRKVNNTTTVNYPYLSTQYTDKGKLDLLVLIEKATYRNPEEFNIHVKVLHKNLESVHSTNLNSILEFAKGSAAVFDAWRYMQKKKVNKQPIAKNVQDEKLITLNLDLCKAYLNQTPVYGELLKAIKTLPQIQKDELMNSISYIDTKNTTPNKLIFLNREAAHEKAVKLLTVEGKDYILQQASTQQSISKPKLEFEPKDTNFANNLPKNKEVNKAKKIESQNLLLKLLRGFQREARSITAKKITEATGTYDRNHKKVDNLVKYYKKITQFVENYADFKEKYNEEINTIEEFIKLQFTVAISHARSFGTIKKALVPYKNQKMGDNLLSGNFTLIQTAFLSERVDEKSKKLNEIINFESHKNNILSIAACIKFANSVKKLGFCPELINSKIKSESKTYGEALTILQASLSLPKIKQIINNAKETTKSFLSRFKKDKFTNMNDVYLWLRADKDDIYVEQKVVDAIYKKIQKNKKTAENKKIEKNEFYFDENFDFTNPNNRISKNVLSYKKELDKQKVNGSLAINDSNKDTMINLLKILENFTIDFIVKVSKQTISSLENNTASSKAITNLFEVFSILAVNYGLLKAITKKAENESIKELTICVGKARENLGKTNYWVIPAFLTQTSFSAKQLEKLLNSVHDNYDCERWGFTKQNFKEALKFITVNERNTFVDPQTAEDFLKNKLKEPTLIFDSNKIKIVANNNNNQQANIASTQEITQSQQQPKNTIELKTDNNNNNSQETKPSKTPGLQQRPQQPTKIARPKKITPPQKNVLKVKKRPAKKRPNVKKQLKVKKQPVKKQPKVKMPLKRIGTAQKIIDRHNIDTIVRYIEEIYDKNSPSSSIYNRIRTKFSNEVSQYYKQQNANDPKIKKIIDFIKTEGKVIEAKNKPSKEDTVKPAKQSETKSQQPKNTIVQQEKPKEDKKQDTVKQEKQPETEPQQPKNTIVQQEKPKEDKKQDTVKPAKQSETKPQQPKNTIAQQEKPKEDKKQDTVKPAKQPETKPQQPKNTIVQQEKTTTDNQQIAIENKTSEEENEPEETIDVDKLMSALDDQYGQKDTPKENTASNSNVPEMLINPEEPSNTTPSMILRNTANSLSDEVGNILSQSSQTLMPKPKDQDNKPTNNKTSDDKKDKKTNDNKDAPKGDDNSPSPN